jgi:UDP-2-acetamido-2,6-beta-L-arabino-hexul-4-ose reductase
LLNVEITKLEMISDNRGWITEVLKNQNSENISQIHFSISNPGAVRGNHFHKSRTEWLLVTSGVATISLLDNKSREKKELPVNADVPTLVKIPPNVAHSIINSGDKPMHLLVVTNQNPNSQDPDTYRKVLL